MNILVLDTIHGGTEIAAAYRARGDRVDAVDVYRGESGVSEEDALHRAYDCVIAPVHLDPGNRLLRDNSSRVISHHEAVRRLLGDRIPTPFIEITGARGKTTTALALATCMPGKGVVHTSNGTFLVPEQTLLWKRSITPASVLPAAEYAYGQRRWLIAEESLGVTGAGNLAIITSPEDYPVASGKKRALALKTGSAERAARVLTTEGISLDNPDRLNLPDVANVEGDRCRITYGGKTAIFTTPLLRLAGYRTPLMLAGTAALILGGDPDRLSGFPAIDGRLAVEHTGGWIIIDNSNSGTNAMTTREAAELARSICGETGFPLTLVIGQEAHAVCEGFSPESVGETIREIRPDRVILVDGEHCLSGSRVVRDAIGHCPCEEAQSMAEAKLKAADTGERGLVVLAVKRWR
ncbi:MAG: coenzyme F430 synthase [Methanoregulaceae archaeon]